VRSHPWLTLVGYALGQEEECVYLLYKARQLRDDVLTLSHNPEADGVVPLPPAYLAQRAAHQAPLPEVEVVTEGEGGGGGARMESRTPPVGPCVEYVVGEMKRALFVEFMQTLR
jgi:hypothetical protein